MRKDNTKDLDIGDTIIVKTQARNGKAMTVQSDLLYHQNIGERVFLLEVKEIIKRVKPEAPLLN